MQVSSWMPCIKDKGLQIFTTTADQRYLLGVERFLQTHFPIEMRKAQDGRVTSQITEQDLLHDLLNSEGVVGNRIFVLYGAAGSGKSELMRWLQTAVSVSKPNRGAATVRIARTELDIVAIAERFHFLLSGAYFESTTHHRWTELRKKPLTLAKLLVLSSLERLLDDDNDITSLFYWLVEPVQRNLEKSLNLESDDSESLVLELCSHEDWDALTKQTDLVAMLDHEQFRQQLVETFRYQMMEGTSLPATLRRISNDISKHRGVRPILLIDDLVRSLNLFAGDLMDYFMTLESGEWDVVVGLTPASLQTHARGREMLERIAFLDTIDDRVEKLWLSDDYGHDSYVLTEENCIPFAIRYLSAYRELNGVECLHCSMRHRCSGLDDDGEGRLLAPFNRALLIRIYRKLPIGKGKVRYFVQALREILRTLVRGTDLLTAVRPFVHRETAARCTDRRLADLLEIYGPLAPSTRKVKLDGGLARFWDHNFPDSYEVEPLYTLTDVPSSSVQVTSSEPPLYIDNPDKRAVRDWILGAYVNRHLLQPLRKGSAKFLRLLDQYDAVYRPGIARPTGKLHVVETYMETVPPLVFPDLEQEKGINLRRAIGNAAYDLVTYYGSTGIERRTLEAQLLQEADLVSVIYDAELYRESLTTHIEKLTGMGIDELALQLWLLGSLTHGVYGNMPPGIGKLIPPKRVSELPQEWQYLQEVFTHSDLDAIQGLFHDQYQLRENLYDGPKIHKLTEGHALMSLVERLSTIRTEEIPEHYRLGRRTLSSILKSAQELLDGLTAAMQATNTQDPATAVAVLSSPAWQAYSLRAKHLEQLMDELPDPTELSPDAICAVDALLTDGSTDSMFYGVGYKEAEDKVHILIWK